jgi:pimeloyl-ACP methyl ester carboxylesterase
VSEVEDQAADTEAEARAIVAWVWGGRPPAPRRIRLARALEGVEQHAVPLGDGAVAAWRVGEGPAVLLAHGFSDSQALWSRLMDDLIRRRRSFVALDTPGFGRSTAGPASPEFDTAALLRVADALGPIDAAVGHSMGAATVVAALAEGLPAKRAVTFAIATRFQRQFFQLERRVEATVRPAVLERARQLLVAETPPAGRFDLAAAAATLRIPALLIHSRDDESWSAGGSDYVASHWPGARTHFVDGLGHRDVCRDPDLVRLAADFLCADCA